MLSRVLGIDPGTEISLRGSWSPEVLALLLGLATAAAIVLYWRQRSLKPSRRVTLGVLRATLYAVLLVILFQPVLIVGRTIRVPSNVLVLVDASESMNVQDSRSTEEEQREAALALGETRYVLPPAQEELARSIDCLRRVQRQLEEPGAAGDASGRRTEDIDSARRALQDALELCSSASVEPPPAPLPSDERARATATQLQGRLPGLIDRLRRLGVGGDTTAPAAPTDIPDALLPEIRQIGAELRALESESFRSLPPVADPQRQDLTSPSRWEVAQGILAHPDLPFLRGDELDATVRYFRFGERLEPTTGEGETLWRFLQGTRAAAAVTRLGDTLNEAVERYSGQAIDGVVVLTDGGSNDGVDPLEVARRLGDLGVPVYPVGIGLPSPDDVRIKSVVVQDTVFENDRVPVKVEVAARGFGTRADVTVSLDGDEVARRSITLSEESQFVPLSFVPEGRSGTVELQVSVTPQEGEVTTENNEARKTLRVIQEKIKVLYVEGRPRWEYRYLRAILLRDPRLSVQLLLTEGDPDLARASPLYIVRFPEDPSESDRYDLVILGDVPSYYFTPDQLDWIASLVREHGGSLLALTGSGYGPGTFKSTPIADVLPVEVSDGWVDVDPSVYPVPTAAGARSLLVEIDPLPDRNSAAWSLARPLHRLPRIAGVKPGGTVLATLSDRSESASPYPLIAWHRYGAGKSMLVATDQLWRLRFRRGDTYHARFWGQAIRFLTLSRLLGENKRIRIETDRREYLEGERIEVYANVLSDTYEPVALSSYSIEVLEPDSASERVVPLQAVPGTPGLYRASFRADAEGTHVIRAPTADRPYSQSVEVVVQPSSRERLEPEMQEGLLRKLAELSGGTFLRVGDLPRLPAYFRSQPREIHAEEEKELWDHWGLFAFLLAGAGIEWLLRRRSDLA